MSDKYDGINGFTSGSIAFLLMIVFLLMVIGISDVLARFLYPAADSAWMFFVIWVVLYIYYKELKRR